METYALYARWKKCRDSVASLSTSGTGATVFYQGFFACPFGATYISSDLLGNEALIIEFDQESASTFESPNISGLLFEVKSLPKISQDKPLLSISIDSSFELVDAFEAFTVTLVRNLSLAKNYGEAVSKIYDVSEEYSDFFKNGGKFALSANEEQGLVGELLALEEAIGVFGEKAVAAWSGPDKNKHDFIFAGNNAVEIKTTTNQSRLSITVSNENQLCFDDGCLLFLKIYVLERNPSGMMVDDLIQRIDDKLVASPSAKGSFHEKLLESKVVIGLTPFKRHFALVSSHQYLVDKSFPRLTAELIRNVSTRIYGLKYHLSLDDIEEYIGDPYERLAIE